MPPPLCEHRGVWGATGHVSRAHLCTVGPASPPHPTTRHPFCVCVSITSVPRCGAQKETRLNAREHSTSEKLQSGRRRTKSREASPSPETGGTGGLEMEGPVRRGF